MKPTTSAVENFAQELRGALIGPDHSEYETARTVWNGRIDRRPALIVRCTGVADVVTALTFARDQGLPLTVRGGGHDIAGRSVVDDGLVLDLSPMNSVHIDPRRKRARVGAGATWGDFDHEAQAFGLATPGGSASKIGVAGLTLGGGYAILSRKYGLTIDSLRSTDVVTANGRLIHASSEEHPDLFWALRGGGGGFGIVTSFVFDLHEVGPEVLVAHHFHPVSSVREVLHFYRTFVADAPDELTPAVAILRLPAGPPFPEAARGKLAVALSAYYVGAIEEGERTVAPLREYGEPYFIQTEAVSYAEFIRNASAAHPDGARYYWKSHYLRGLSDGAIEAIASHAEPVLGPLTILSLFPLGGAGGRVDPTSTAYPHREAAFTYSIYSGWTDPASDVEIIAWTKEVHAALAPHATGGIYPNHIGHDDLARMEAVYGDNYARLRQVKKSYDPDDFFHVNQNVSARKG